MRVMWSIYNAIMFALIMLWTAAWISAALLARACGAGEDFALRMAARGWAPGVLLGAGVRLRVEGLERVDWSRPYLFVANHQSVIDNAALFRALPVPVRFLLKAEMARVPFLGWYARATGMLFIIRDARRSGPLLRREAAALLAAGHGLCLFPEGTRSLTGEVAPFKSGALQAAIDAGVAIVPVALQGAGRVLPVGGISGARPGPIRVGIGVPLETRVDGAPLPRQALADRAHADVLAMLRQWA